MDDEEMISTFDVLEEIDDLICELESQDDISLDLDGENDDD